MSSRPRKAALNAGVSLNVERAGNTHSKCVICKSKFWEGGSRVIHVEDIFDILSKFNVLCGH